MIQPHNGQRGVIGEQHGLTRLTTTLETLSQGQTQQQARETQSQAQLATLAQHVTMLTTWGTRLCWAVLGLGILTLGLSGLVGWQLTHPPQLEYGRALGAVDASLLQQWSSLPKAVQEALTATYTRLGLASPGDRPPPRKETTRGGKN